MKDRKQFIFLMSVLILACKIFSDDLARQANALTTKTIVINKQIIDRDILPNKRVLKTSDRKYFFRENNNDFLITQEVFTGKASWYGSQFHGRLTANGETFDQNALTAAHKTLPFGTKVKVTNIDNGLSVVVRINDRGPFIKDRIIDLSYGAARNIGIIDRGVANVKLEILGK